MEIDRLIVWLKREWERECKRVRATSKRAENNNKKPFINFNMLTHTYSHIHTHTHTIENKFMKKKYCLY